MLIPRADHRVQTSCKALQKRISIAVVPAVHRVPVGRWEHRSLCRRHKRKRSKDSRDSELHRTLR